MTGYSVVIPTVGRPCLADCLRALAAAAGPVPAQVVVVDDRPAALAADPVLSPGGPGTALPVTVIASGGAGPAAARNAGWRRTSTPWVAFLDDDVRVGRDWRRQLSEDLTGLPDHTAGVQGLLTVPSPDGRRPTDWERTTMGLARARWITADMAYRRAALAESGGFDERFPRAFREDADLALRLLADGWELRQGRRHTVHPVRPASAWISIRGQAGNADDALMRVLHGRGWQARAEADRGRLPRHALITAAVLAAAGLAAAGRRRPAMGARGGRAGRDGRVRRGPDRPGTADGARGRGDDRDQPGHPRAGVLAPGAGANPGPPGPAVAADPGRAVRPGRHADPGRAV